MSCEHTWKKGPIVDFTGRVQVICTECLDVESMPWGDSKALPRWTDADYDRDAARIEERYG